MGQVLIIPDRSELDGYIKLAAEYGAGFEYNDFFNPDLLEDETNKKAAEEEYLSKTLPAYCTLHGAFYDVIPFSPDARIREVAKLRIRQSMESAEKLGAKAVVFHTSYNPSLNSEGYVSRWIDNNVKFWSEILSQNPERFVYLENTFEATPVLFERLAEQLCKYENFGLCLDYAHACLSKTAPEEWVKRLGRFIKHIHINDNDGVSDLHQAWGDGKLDRACFYRCYEKYLEGAAVLVETANKDDTIRSLCKLEEEGFLK